MNKYHVLVRATQDDAYDIEADTHADAEQKAIQLFHEEWGYGFNSETFAEATHEG